MEAGAIKDIFLHTQNILIPRLYWPADPDASSKGKRLPVISDFLKDPEEVSITMLLKLTTS